MMTTEQMLADLVQLDSSEYKLSDWETEFVDSCEKRVRDGRDLTPTQISVLSSLWDSVFVHGKRSRR